MPVQQSTRTRPANALE